MQDMLNKIEDPRAKELTQIVSAHHTCINAITHLLTKKGYFTDEELIKELDDQEEGTRQQLQLLLEMCYQK